MKEKLCKMSLGYRNRSGEVDLKFYIKIDSICIEIRHRYYYYYYYVTYQNKCEYGEGFEHCVQLEFDDGS